MGPDNEGKMNEAVSIPLPRFGNRFVVSADGQTIAIAGLTDERKSWYIRVWNLNDGKERCVPMTMPASRVIALCSDGGPPSRRCRRPTKRL